MEVGVEDGKYSNHKRLDAGVYMADKSYDGSMRL